jgi:hypothetical protein
VTLAAFLATPHDGAMDAVKTATGMEAAPGLTRAQTRQLNASADYPACYQLFPLLNAPVLWSGASYDPLMLVSPDVWNALGLQVDFQKPIQDFRGRLDPTRKPDTCRYFAVVSAAHDTSTTLIRPDAGTPFQDHPFPTAGDGTVEIESSTALRCQTLFVTASHVGVTQADDTLACLRKLLGVPVSRDFALEIALPTPTLSVSPQFLHAGDAVEIVIVLGASAAGPIKGRILVTEAAGTMAVRTIPIDADVPGLSKFSMVAGFPDVGEFIISFDTDNGLPSNDTHVFVRSPDEADAETRH